MKNITIRMEQTKIDKLRALAKSDARTLSAYIRKILEEKLNADKGC